ncbi:MAG: DUF1990 domain-containing protein [Actinomycetota bacterium]|nr:DUF1990 domain-containing protein [Actinomycetota bacterium]
MRQVRRLTPAEADQLRGEPFTYAEVGATATADPSGLPVGYRPVQHKEFVGEGSKAFESASRKLMTWRMHLDSGLRVTASSTVVEPASVVLMRLGPGPAAIKIPCRVVHVVDEPDRQGFAYGTLPGHPETGEELFVVAIDDRDRVSLTVTVFSRAQSRLAKLGGPLTWAMQQRALRKYAAALRAP